MSICLLPHRDAKVLDDLPESQAGSERHKCAGCSFEQGFHDGFNGQAPNFASIEQLPISQAQTARHKDPKKAYAKGYRFGKTLYENGK